MEKKIYDFISDTFHLIFNEEDFIVQTKPFESYFNKDGSRDKRRKYYDAQIILRSLRRFDVVANTEILGRAFTKAYKVMKQVEENYKDIVFSTCTYDEKGFLVFRFATAAEVALVELNKSAHKSFYLDG